MIVEMQAFWRFDVRARNSIAGAAGFAATLVISACWGSPTFAIEPSLVGSTTATVTAESDAPGVGATGKSKRVLLNENSFGVGSPQQPGRSGLLELIRPVAGLQIDGVEVPCSALRDLIGPVPAKTTPVAEIQQWLSTIDRKDLKRGWVQNISCDTFHVQITNDGPKSEEWEATQASLVAWAQLASALGAESISLPLDMSPFLSDEASEAWADRLIFLERKIQAECKPSTVRLLVENGAVFSYKQMKAFGRLVDACRRQDSRIAGVIAVRSVNYRISTALKDYIQASGGVDSNADAFAGIRVVTRHLSSSEERSGYAERGAYDDLFSTLSGLVTKGDYFVSIECLERGGPAPQTVAYTSTQPPSKPAVAIVTQPIKNAVDYFTDRVGEMSPPSPIKRSAP